MGAEGRGVVSELRFDRRTVIANILTLFSGSVIAQGITSVAFLLTARQLGPTSYGQYTSCFVLVGFTSIAYNLGLDIWLLREGGRQPQMLNEYLGSILFVKLLLGALWYLALAAVAPHLNALLGSQSFPPELVMMAALWAWFDNGLATLLTVYKARLDNKVTSAIQAGSRGVWLLATLVLIGLGRVDVISYVRIRTIIAVVSFAGASALAAQDVGYVVKTGMICRLLREAFPFAASEFLAWASMRLDMLIIALMLGEHDVGLYAPAVGLVNALFLLPATVYAVAVPVLSNLFHSNRAQFWLTARRILVVLAVIGLAMTLGTFLAAGFVGDVLGAAYRSSEPLLRVMSIILFFHALTYGMAALLVVTNQQTRRVGVQAVTTALSAALNVAVVMVAGIMGVAWVYVLMEAFLLGGYSCVVWWERRRLDTEQLCSGVMS